MRTKRLAVKLTVYLLIIMIPTLATVGGAIVLRETRTMEEMTLNEAKTVALTAAKAYSQILNRAVDAGDLTMDEILKPHYEPMTFKDAQGQPIVVEDARYHTKLSDVLAKYGVGEIQNEIVDRGKVLFASGMKVDGYVPWPNKKQNNPPRGMGTEADKLWDRKNSRQFRMYDESEPRSAAGFRGNPAKGSYTLVQDYFRDTGETAWDVAAPIFVKGEHFGGFRIGVSKDNLRQRSRDLLINIGLAFGLLVLVTSGLIFFVAWYHTKPLPALSAKIRELSKTTDYELLGAEILPPDNTEIGEIADSVNRLRKSLAAAIRRLDEPSGVVQPAPEVNVHTKPTASFGATRVE